MGYYPSLRVGLGELSYMSTLHSKKAKAFLQNQDYARWHDNTFWAVRQKRDNMAQGLDEWDNCARKPVR